MKFLAGFIIVGMLVVAYLMGKNQSDTKHLIDTWEKVYKP